MANRQSLRARTNLGSSSAADMIDERNGASGGLKTKNISAYKLAKETGISESLFSKWKKNPTSEISSSNLVRIADYLDCSVDFLLGRTDKPEVNR